MAKITNEANIPAWRKSLDILRWRLGNTIKAVNEADSSGLSKELQKLIDSGMVTTTDTALVGALSTIEWGEVEAAELKAAADLSTQIFLSANVEPMPVGPED